MIGYLLVLAMVFCTVASQLLLKKSLPNISFDDGFSNFILSLYNTTFVIAVMFILIAPIFYILSLSELDLNIAFSFTALQHIFVIFGASFFFGEEISRRRLSGVFIIVLGILFISY